MREKAVHQFESPDLPVNGYTILALLLLSITTYAQDDSTRARTLLDQAIYMAVEVGMNSRIFANREKDPVWAESWRRTYWGLYTTNLIISGFGLEPNLAIDCIEGDVDLPSDGTEKFVRPRSFEEYEIRDFEDKVPVFSSFAYFIDLVKIAASFSSVPYLDGKDREAAVENADTKLIAWKSHLPREKQSIVKANGEIDYILFHSYVLWQSLIIGIHGPLSRLHRIRVGCNDQNLTPADRHEDPHKEIPKGWLHTKRAFEAIADTTKLCALPIPIIKQSPLVTNCIVSSTEASILECSPWLPCSQKSQARDKIRLALAALNDLGKIWDLSAKMSSNLKKMARNISAASSSPPDILADELVLRSQNLVNTLEKPINFGALETIWLGDIQPNIPLAAEPDISFS
ncbi:fungal specific transcription factor domain-containing protein [Aspergillus tanneri]|uniref:Xylanolytic transcriptional activator regulatory domain-containing protein n=1 Tax=Aspergillus tanneri TaxID=1220188 RepID=A0A5M9ME78_9EURO|nr:uncharacterized protein ATNIH1004_006694 [Aspergillus tanneri]KAA8645275.1 hypothetical protein ATNIH1004_006694 [Aspergillus tanneri]